MRRLTTNGMERLTTNGMRRLTTNGMRRLTTNDGNKAALAWGADFRVADLKLSARIEPFPFVVSPSTVLRTSLANHERALPGQLGLSAPGRSLNHSKSSATIKPFPFVVSSSNHERKLLDQGCIQSAVASHAIAWLTRIHRQRSCPSRSW
jgi:hypothetical protein